MTKYKKLILLGAMGAAFLVPTASQAIGFSIDIGDRPYYNHGARYWNGDYQYIWVPGHRWHGRWIHGHYRRGEHRRHWDRRFDRDRDGDRH